MKWNTYEESKPKLYQRVLIIHQGLIWSARYIYEEQSSNTRSTMEYIFLVDPIDKKDHIKRYYDNHKVAGYSVDWWISLEDVPLPFQPERLSEKTPIGDAIV